MPRCQAVHQNHPNHASREKRGRDPDRPRPAKNCPREAGTEKQKHTRVGEGPREAATLKEPKAVPEKPGQ